MQWNRYLTYDKQALLYVKQATWYVQLDVQFCRLCCPMDLRNASFVNAPRCCHHINRACRESRVAQFTIYRFPKYKRLIDSRSAKSNWGADSSCPPQAENFEDFGNSLSRKYVLESIQKHVFSAKLPPNPPKFPPAAPHPQILKSLVLGRKTLKSLVSAGHPPTPRGGSTFSDQIK